MNSRIVIGDSGFIGSTLMSHLGHTDGNLIGINRQRILIIENGVARESPRKSDQISTEILPFLSNASTVINTMWGRNDRAQRDSKIHLQYADSEISLISSLKDTECRYISFGSIAEINDESISPSRETAYAKAKILVADYLAKSELLSTWLRVASLYGPGDTRHWLLPKLLESWQLNKDVTLEQPMQMINLCHIDSLVSATIALIEKDTQGAFNVTTHQWITVSALKESFNNLIEPKYLKRSLGSFSHSDPNVLYVDTPQISKYFADLKIDHKS